MANLKSAFLSRNTVALTLQFVGLLLTFGSNVLIARLYGENAYGIFALVSSWAVLFSVFGLFGMDARHLSQIPDLKFKGGRFAIKSELSESLYVNIISISLSVLSFFLLIRYSPFQQFTNNYRFFVYALLLIPCYVLMNNLLYFLRAMKSIIVGELIDKVTRPLVFAGFIILFYYSSRSTSAVDPLKSNISGLIVIIVILFLSALYAISNSPRLSNERLKKFNPALNLRYTFLNFLYILSIRLDILVLGLFVSSSELGHYTIASRYGDIFSYPVTMLNLAFPALLSETIHHHDKKHASLMPYAIARKAFWLCIATGIFFILFAPSIFSLYGKNFESASKILPIFLVATLFNASNGLTDVYFMITGKENKVIAARVIAIAATIATATCLIPKYSITGAAYSVLAGNIVYYISIQYFYWREFRRIVNPFFHAFKKSN